jgi:hypothetical protein
MSGESRLATAAPDLSLHDWRDAGERQYHLLLGNGASMAVWNRFKYPSLFKVAKYQGKQRLTERDIKLFEVFQTQNFEQVLGSLATAERVCHALGMPCDDLRGYYERIKNALCTAVKETHLPYATIGSTVLSAIHDEIVRYRSVFSTNYDLILYWAINQGTAGFKDFFWEAGPRFNLADTYVDAPENSTQVYYLHGGLHLVRSEDGRTTKLRGEVFNNILEQFGTVPPLFISEGEHQMKLASIRRSDYLSFAYQQLTALEGKLCIFGHSLGPSDSHIVDAIRASHVDDIAISVHGDLTHSEKHRLIESLTVPKRNVWFFRAGTHPLGHEALCVRG